MKQLVVLRYTYDREDTIGNYFNKISYIDEKPKEVFDRCIKRRMQMNDCINIPNPDVLVLLLKIISYTNMGLFFANRYPDKSEIINIITLDSTLSRENKYFYNEYITNLDLHVYYKLIDTVETMWIQDQYAK